MHDIFIGNVYQWLIWEKHIKWVIYDKIEPLHFRHILGATLNAFKVTPITSIIMTSFVDYLFIPRYQAYPHQNGYSYF